jgi:hypothetical protein
MYNLIIAQALAAIIKFLIGADYKRIESQVKIWADKKVEGASKRKGVLDALEVIGLTLAPNLVNLAIEIAVTKLKTVK